MQALLWTLLLFNGCHVIVNKAFPKTRVAELNAWLSCCTLSQVLRRGLPNLAKRKK